ncbi:MAG: hypothetical protein DRG78_00510 [Epsilonproteobacteria bacterium]|nr:MAG: hypothetical protein DRG78_00510 [Campylobacterota bacterium]
MTDEDKNKVNKVKNRLKNAMYGEPIDEFNRDENGLDQYPELVYIKVQIQKALLLIEKIV